MLALVSQTTKARVDLQGAPLVSDMNNSVQGRISGKIVHRLNDLAVFSLELYFTSRIFSNTLQRRKACIITREAYAQVSRIRESIHSDEGLKAAHK